MNNANHKQIGINVIFLFLRSILIILINLYAARVLLRKLGIEDYGIYNVVGGIIVTFNSFRLFFSSSIQRFLNFAKGQGDFNQLNKIFCIGVEIQVFLAIVLLIIMETIGLIAFINLNLTQEQFETAKVLYQLSIATAIVSMLTVPYDAVIIANEKMNVFAFFSIFDNLMRLIAIFLISLGPFHRLINYAILVLLVSVIIRFTSAFYCSHTFMEAHFKWTWDKQIFRKMGTFAGWNFFGNTGFSLTHEGVNYVLNIIGGIHLNAARTIVYQIFNALSSLTNNISVAFKPQTNAFAGKDDKSIFYGLLCYNAKTMFVLYIMITIPLIILSYHVVHLWLGQVPDFVVAFIPLIGLYNLLRTLHEPIDLFFNSLGELKYYQLIEISSMILNIPLSVFLLKIGMPLGTVFLGMSFIEIINHICIVSLATLKFKFPIKQFIKDVYIPFFIMLFISLIIFTIYRVYLQPDLNFISLLFYSILAECFLALTAYFYVLKKQERKNIINFAISKIKKTGSV